MKRLLPALLAILLLCGCQSEAVPADDATCGPKGVPYGIIFESPEDYQAFCDLAAFTDEEYQNHPALSWPFYTKEAYTQFAAALEPLNLHTVLQEEGTSVHISYWDLSDYHVYIHRSDSVTSAAPPAN